MGADVYLESLSTAAKAKWEPAFNAAVIKRDKSPNGSSSHAEYQKQVEAAYEGMFGEGYFRDCYNGYGLFANLGSDLSWWRDVVPMLDDNGYLPIERAKDLLALVEVATIDLTSAKRVAKEQRDEAPKVETYESWRNELIDILRLSIERNEPLRMSL